MATAKTKIEITHGYGTTQKVKEWALAGSSHAFIGKVVNLLSKIGSGHEDCKIALTCNEESGVAASGTITFSGVGAADDTILINGVTFTAVASGAAANQWNVGASATLSAAALAASINASVTALVLGHVVATSSGAIVTITARAKGVTGNAITIAEGVDGSSHMAVSGARLTGGTAETSTEFKFGAN
jgi:phage tail sheath gpL-like